MRPVRTLLHLRPGEARRVTRIALIGAAYAAATSLGDDIAQAVFVARAGAEALPTMFLFKGILDVAAAAAYLPLTRGRSATRVWQVALFIYTASVAGGWLWASSETVVGGYGLYVLHESSWTILTIHWAVLILEVFDANQARRLFPLLFAATRLGGIGAGAALGWMAGFTSALHLLPLCIGFALLAAVLTIGTGNANSIVVADKTSLRSATRTVVSSPLVRAIAYSTAAMVLVRYGLRIVSLEEINHAYLYEEDLVAEFLGEFRVWANLVGAILGILVVPKLLTWVGVGAMNLLYAVATLAAFVGLYMAPTLTTAATARFVEQQFKDATRTPLSALFYGAEPAHLRSAARAFMFGAIIPAATALTALVFEIATRAGTMQTITLIGGGLAVLFVVLSQLLTARWRRRIAERLAEEVAAAPAPEPSRLATGRKLLAAELDDDECGRVDSALCALVSSDDQLAALGEEVLAETISRRRAHDVARFLRDRGGFQAGEPDSTEVDPASV